MGTIEKNNSLICALILDMVILKVSILEKFIISELNYYLMEIFSHFFSSEEAIAKKIVKTDKNLQVNWKSRIKAAYESKRKIVETLKIQDKTSLSQLKKILDLEIGAIKKGEIGERELIISLEKLEHSEKIKRVEKLDQCLYYIETKYEYIYGLLQQLHTTANNQLYLVEKLLAEPKDPEKLIEHLRLQINLESVIVEKVDDVKIFNELFIALAKGEHIIHQMNAKEKRLIKKMQGRMDKIFSGEINKGITDKWATIVSKAVQDYIQEGYDKGFLDGHYDLNFQFVNRPGFVNIVRLSIATLGKRNVSEEMINVFVETYREWFNHIRG